MYTPDIDGIIYYGKANTNDIDSLEEDNITGPNQIINIYGIQTDSWNVTENVDKFFRKSSKKNEKTLSEKYKSWNYYK